MNSLLARERRTCVWMTHIITLFTLIVSRASKPLRGRLKHHVTMMANQVMMTVIHTNLRRDPLQRVRDDGMPMGG